MIWMRLSLLFALFLSPTAHAELVCSELFNSRTLEYVLDRSSEVTRSFVKDFLRENKDIPAFIKQTSRGEVPVILLNKETAKRLKSLLENSAGYMFSQQVGYNNDHGLMRVGTNIIDADLPGERGYGEIHDTGLSWKNINSYLPRRDTSSDVMIETGYLLALEDQASVELYQRVRRAAIFRIPFTFGGNNKKTGPNMLESSGENCFSFCKASTLSYDVTLIKRKINQLGINNVDALMATDTVKKFLAETSNAILKADVYDDYTFNWKMANGKNTQEQLKDIIPENLSIDQKKTLINWIIALHVTQKYIAVKQKYEITSESGLGDMDNGKATFILIYADMTKANAFKNVTFTSRGVFYNWNSDNQKPLQD